MLPKNTHIHPCPPSIEVLVFFGFHPRPHPSGNSKFSSMLVFKNVCFGYFLKLHNFYNNVISVYSKVCFSLLGDELPSSAGSSRRSCTNLTERKCMQNHHIIYILFPCDTSPPIFPCYTAFQLPLEMELSDSLNFSNFQEL